MFFFNYVLLSKIHTKILIIFRQIYNILTKQSITILLLLVLIISDK